MSAWFVPDAVEEEVAAAVGVCFCAGCFTKVHGLPLGGTVDRPLGDAGAVGVAGSCKICPVELHFVREPAVFGTPESFGAGVEGAKHVLDIVRVKGSGGGSVVAVAGTSEREQVSIHR